MEFEIDDSVLNNFNYFNIEQNETHLKAKSLSVLNSFELTYNYFFENYMNLNTPCLIKGVSDNWKCRSLWFTGNNTINYEYLHETYGNQDVVIYNCLEKYYNSQKTYNTKFSNYLYYFKEENKSRLDYLKDWHLKNSTTNDNFYEVPVFFASDWLNEYHVDSLNDDYRFVYMGPKGTWTPFHADVFSSYSWSVNVFGRKRWILLPPGEENSLKDSFGNLPYDLKDRKLTQDHFEVVQEAGDAIFVPSGWYHQVWNMEDTVSINHNWVNGCNIDTMYKAMAAHLTEIRKEIADCTDMPNFEEHCQLMLDASFGMNYPKFYQFMKYIATSRIKMLNENKDRILFHGHIIGKNHNVFDLMAIKNVLEMLLNCEILDSIRNIQITPSELLETIVKVIKVYKKS